MRLLLLVAGLLLALLSLSAAADARQHHPARGHRILPGTVGALDTFTQPAGAYSFRKLKSNYAGSAVRLRRTTGGEQDIGFTANGDFDTTAAAAFCAATTCFITTWYDQSGNARHLVQATAGSQPGLTFNCVAAMPCLVHTDTSSMATAANITPATGIASFSMVSRRTVSNGVCSFLRENGAGNRFTAQSGAGNSWILIGGTSGTLANTGAADAVWHAGQAVMNGVSSVVNIDGAEVTGTTTGSVTAGQINIGGIAGTTCSQAEAVLWDNYALTAGERVALNDNQRNYWMPLPLDTFAAPAGAYSFRKLKSTYSGPAIRIRRASDNAETDIGFLGYVPGLGSPLDVAAANAHCAATSCFLTKWYDQSGSALDIVNAVTATQPALVFNCQGSLPCMRSVAGEALVSVGNYTPPAAVTLNAVANRRSGTGACFLRTNGAASNRLVYRAVPGIDLLGSAGTISNSMAEAAWHSVSGIINGAGSSLAADGGAPVTGSVTANVAAGVAGYFGAASTTCDWGEIVFWGSVLSAAEVSALAGNQRSFWGF